MKLTAQEIATLEEFHQWKSCQPPTDLLGQTTGWYRVGHEESKLLDDVASITLKLLAE